MRRLRSDVRGISPVVATIILIAAAGVAAGVIMAYVSGLIIFSPTVRTIVVSDADVFDWDPTVTENYVNGDVALEVKCTAGGLREINGGAATVLVEFLRTGYRISWTIPSFTVATVYSGTWTGPAIHGAHAPTVSYAVPADAMGRLGVGSVMTIHIDVPSGAQSGVPAENIKWTEGDDIRVVITARDAGSDAARLYGTAYKE